MDWIKKLKVSGKYVAMGNVIINKTIGNINSAKVIVFGFLLLLIVIFFNYIMPCPTNSQYIFLRIGFSFGITSVLIPIIGRLKFGSHSFRGLFTLLLILFTYLVNPAVIIKNDNCNLYTRINGQIYLGEKPFQDAIISLPHLNYRTLSNTSGEFLIQWKNGDKRIDSILVNVQSAGIDTSFYWNQEDTPLQIAIADTLIPISKKVIHQLLVSRIKEFEELMKGNYLEWGIGIATDIEELFSLYSSFETFKSNYRNEFLFKGLDCEIAFRKNLLSAGIQVVNQLKPFEKHSFDSCKTYILKSTKFPNYRLHYLLTNENQLQFEISKLQFISEDQYRAKIVFKENIRSVRVLLTCSEKTNGYKIRQMEVYGFLPQEEFDLEFRNGEWTLIKTKSV